MKINKTLKTLHKRKVLSPLKNFLISLFTWNCLSVVAVNKTQTLLLLPSLLTSPKCHIWCWIPCHFRSGVRAALDKIYLYHKKLLQGISTTGGRKKSIWERKQVLTNSFEVTMDIPIYSIPKYYESNKILCLAYFKSIQEIFVPILTRQT